MKRRRYWYPTSFILAICLWFVIFIFFSFWQMTPLGLDPAMADGDALPPSPNQTWSCPVRHLGTSWCTKDDAIAEWAGALPIQILLSFVMPFSPFILVMLIGASGRAPTQFMIEQSTQFWLDPRLVFRANPYVGIGILYFLFAFIESRFQDS